MRWVAAATLSLLLAACTGGDERPGPSAARVGATTTTTTGPPSTTTGAPTTASTTTTTPPAPPATAAPAPAAAPPAAPPTCDVPAGSAEPWPERPRYTARIDINPSLGDLTGTVAVRFVPEAVTDRLVFRLWPNAPRLGRAGGRLDVVAAFLGDRPVTGISEPGGAAPGKPGTIFALPGSFAAGVPVDARLDFRLTIPGAVNDRVARSGQTVRLGSILPVLSWVRGVGWQTSPAVDAFAEAAASEVADYDVTVGAPPGFTTLATGEEVEPGRFVGRAVRDWAATVGRLRLGEARALNGKTAVVVGTPEGGGDPTVLAGRVAAAVDQLSARFGEYPYPRLTMGVSGSLSGGIEFPMHIFLGVGVPNIHLVHEVAHQWFYGVAGNDQYRHPWLDEALATYAESRVAGRLAGQRARSVPRTRLGDSMGYWDAQSGRTYYLAVYVGGLQALGALADAAGGYDVLDCGLRRYHRDRAFMLSGPAEFFEAFQRQTGFDPRPVLAPFGIS